MKKFLCEYKVLRSCKTNENSNEYQERVTVTSQISSGDSEIQAQDQVGTIRTEQYKRDLAEFQARRSSGNAELLETPRSKCGRHSLPVSCTRCTGDPDSIYEKKSAAKCKKKNKKSAPYSDGKDYKGVPNIQFLFQNQVLMPGELFARTSYSEPRRSTRRYRSPEFLKQRHIIFDDEQPISPPLFYKNNALPFDAHDFLRSKGNEEVDGVSEPVQQDKNETDDKLWEVMSELKDLDQWADEQLQNNTTSTSRTDDTGSDASALGLPLASSCNLNMGFDKDNTWTQGKWGVVPVQIKKLSGVTLEKVERKLVVEINILRKCRHPNVILLMGLYPGVHDEVYIVCERFIDSLYGIIHEQGRTLSAQTSVHYAVDIVNALAFLKMHKYLHTDLNSSSIVVTAQDTAKLADLSPCVKEQKKCKIEKNYDDYSKEPVYVNIEDTLKSRTPDSEPLLSARSSENCLQDSVKKQYKSYCDSEYYRWQAPELFDPDEEGFVHPCSKSDVYSLCLVLWECCNASIPWQSYTYEKLKKAYTVWNVGFRLPQDGTYPGCLLSLLQKGLCVQREERYDLTALQSTLQIVEENLNKMEYIVIPQRVGMKKSDFSSQAWDSITPTDSDCHSPKTIEHNAVVHPHSSTDSGSPIYHTVRKTAEPYDRVDKCFLSDEDVKDNMANKYERLEKDYSSACSTPISKFRERNKDLTPGTLHRSDSTEYCSILSPDSKHFAFNDCSFKDQSGEPVTAKLSRSFTPKSYKPLQIKVPDFKLDSIRDIVKNQNKERGSYNFDIQNYSLPNTPIARSNKLRKNAWLSGELDVKEKSLDKSNNGVATEKTSKSNSESPECVLYQNQTQENQMETSLNVSLNPSDNKSSEALHDDSHASKETIRDAYTGLKRIPDPPYDFSFSEIEEPRRTTWFTQSAITGNSRYKVEDEILATVNVKPLVAIHEKWIQEANKKTGRSLSLPEDSRKTVRAVKPASHCTDTLQKSLPQLFFKPSLPKPKRATPVSPASSWKSGPWDQCYHSRDAISKSVNIPIRGFDRESRRDSDKSTITDDNMSCTQKIDQATDTSNIEDFIRDMIRKEFQFLSDHEMAEPSNRKTQELINKGVANVLESLKEDADIKSVKSFSKVKINGNNKPLLQITFSRNGENSMQVLDNCVNVTIGENNAKEKLNISIDDTLTEEIHVNALKRCQAFNAIQEAKSTEDLYIDDDISTHMQENFGGKVKLIPLHGSLHEILCDREEDCCLLKVKQENGCDSIYFKCDTSDTESRDAIDGSDRKDTVVFKRSISVVEERIQRVFPKDKRQTPVAALKKLSDKLKSRPKSEVFVQNINKDVRALSNSSPSLFSGDKEVEVNIENVMSYQDSSSDECLKCAAENDEFEIIEREIEEELSNTHLSTLACNCLEKISEENLSTIHEEEK
ncbi:unnamed protein product [Leptosia nina]|uniref:Protein kinase domain-containing protein n=1 Tax=Leptosia nina TaxID=320188 RepID=A0AAV1IZJ5_9NEOP